MLLAYATWANYKIIDKRSSERIERGLDVLQEHALKVFQTVEHAMAEANEVLRGSSDEGIRSNETFYSERFKRIHDGLPQIQSIWAFDAEGRPLVASTVRPVPPNLINADRDYFRAQVQQDGGTYCRPTCNSGPLTT